MKRRIPKHSFPDRNELTRRRIMDNKVMGLTATLEPAQWDRIGSMLMSQLNQHKTEMAALEPIVSSLRAQLQAKPAVATNGMRSVPPPQDIPEVFPEPDVPSTA